MFACACLRRRVLSCFFRQCVLDYSWALIKHCKWKSQHLSQPWNTTQANKGKHGRTRASRWDNGYVSVPVYSHGHFKLVKPLLLQLPGLEKQLKACVPLLVSHVEPVAPLRRSWRRTTVKLRHRSGGTFPAVDVHSWTLRVLRFISNNYNQFLSYVDLLD